MHLQIYPSWIVGYIWVHSIGYVCISVSSLEDPLQRDRGTFPAPKPNSVLVSIEHACLGHVLLGIYTCGDALPLKPKDQTPRAHGNRTRVGWDCCIADASIRILRLYVANRPRASHPDPHAD
ncbi:hypothetical protein KQX54_019047 [Cotesia glomerata]|uniref:Uncharacterized protein n=1 Tax=Cotesia glomerata TaxID=32391 RepID=A0AAV7I625_COTGL|nr:hypothetical protein KQX54_019047 [Cotesia glomerata]